MMARRPNVLIADHSPGTTLDSPAETLQSGWMSVNTHRRDVPAEDAVPVRGRKLTMRRAYLAVHLWVGIIAALFLFALGVSGSIVAFEN
jgi:hypothetical protein